VTTTELTHLLQSATGKSPDKIEIGQKLSAVDYLTSAIKAREIGESYQFREMVRETNNFIKTYKELIDSFKFTEDTY